MKKMKWISVEDRLPKSHSRPHTAEFTVSSEVLVYDRKQGLLIAYLMEEDDSFDWVAVQIINNHLITEVTHWMPLPELPDEVD